MYAYFKGLIDSVQKDKIILDVNNIGYEIYMPENEIQKLENVKGMVKVNTYLHVREDDMKLYGFLSIETLSFFRKLISVRGVGTRIAIGIISHISPSDMCIAIATEDVKSLKTIPGIGPKMAQKIIFELKDKVQEEGIIHIKNNVKSSIVSNTNVQEAIVALQVLGYSERNVKDKLLEMNIESDSVEDIIRKVLKEMQNL